MIVIVNGLNRELPPEATVATLVAALADPHDGRGVAVAVEGTVVPRADWPRTSLREGASVEVLTAVQGG